MASFVPAHFFVESKVNRNATQRFEVRASGLDYRHPKSIEDRTLMEQCTEGSILFMVYVCFCGCRMNNLNQRQQGAPSTFVKVLSVTDINGNEVVYVDEGQHGAVDVGVQEVDNGGEPAEMAVIRQAPCRPPETLILTDAVAETYDVDASYNDVV